MKKMGKILLTLLLAAVIAATAAVSANATRAPMTIGDVDGDQDVTVLDATRIQRWLVKLEDTLMSKGGEFPQKYQEYIGDINGDGKCNIFDVSFIQRMAAGLEDVKKWDLATWAYYIEDTRLYANYDSGKARAGTPVTFHADVPGYNGTPDPNRPTEPYTYKFLINGEVVQERSEKTDMTYTFDEAGSYKISVVYYNGLDCTTENHLWDYQVVEPYSLETPVIVSALFPDESHSHIGTGDLHIRAEGGEGPYQYLYRIEDTYGVEIPSGWYAEEPEDSKPRSVITTGYIDSPVLDIPAEIRQRAEMRESFPITVNVRDSKGNVSETVMLFYSVDHLVG